MTEGSDVFQSFGVAQVCCHDTGLHAGQGRRVSSTSGRRPGALPVGHGNAPIPRRTRGLALRSLAGRLARAVGAAAALLAVFAVLSTAAQAQTVDTTAPSLSSAWVDGAVLVLTYDEALDATSVPGTGAFSVTVGGTAAALSEVAVDGSEVTLTLAAAASAGQAVTLSYTVPTGANAMPIQDEAGNDAAALSDEAVENYTATPLTDTYEDEVTVPADWSLIPGGVAPGERFRLLFVTSTKRDAKLMVIDNYDPHVQDAAAAGHADIRGYAPQFRVLGCTLLSSAARNRTGTTYTGSDKGVPIYWLGGAKVADDYEDFYDGDWDSNAPRHESGALGPTADGADAQVFTGCNADGSKSASARPLGGTGSNNNVRVGWPGSNGQEIVYQSIGSGNTRSFYGLSTVFRVSINNAGDTAAPSLSSARVDGATLVLSYDEALDETSVPGTDAFSIDVAGTAAAPSGVAIDGSAVTLTLATAVTAGQAVTLSYTVPSGANAMPIQDGDGYNAAALSDEAVSNITGDTTAPSLSSAQVDGATLVLTYDETLDVDSVPGTDAFSIEVDGTAAAPSEVAVDGSEVTLTLASAASAGQAVTLSYTVPSGATPQPIQDEAGNDAAALSDRAVVNYTVTPLPGTYEDEVAVPDDWGLIPSGLGSGDRFRLLFVSSTKRSAVTSAIEDYDILVRNAAGAGHADIRGYAPQFKVLGCTLASAARNRTGTTYTASDKGVPVYWLGGARVADDYEDFYDGDWDSNAPRHESGALGPTADGDGSEVFTGCNANGTIATSGRIGNTANNQVNVGWPGGNGQEIDHGTTNRNNSRSYYGLSTVFRVGDTTAPSLSSAWVDGAVLVLTYDEALDATSVPGTGAFSVTVGGAAAALSEVAIDGSEVTLTLATAASAGQAVTLSYTVPTGANAMPIQDEAGNDAAALSDEAVENYTATPLTDTYEDEVTVPADWSLIPGGVAPGERFRLLFVTSTKRDAKLMVIDNYDPHVQDAAAAGHADIRGYAPQFRVLGCTLLSSAARNRTGTTYTGSDKGVPIYWLGGAKVADDYEDFYDGDWDSNAPRHESGALGPTADGADAQVFTGCNADGSKSASARPLGGTGSNNNVRVGWPGSNGQEIVYQSIGSGNTRSFYGLSTVFRVSINNAGDTAAPSLSSARVDGATLVLSYDEALDETSVPGTDAFSIDVAGTAAAPSGVAIDGSAVTLTLATAVTASQAVTLSYTVPSGANAMPIQDGDGYNAAALSDEAVSNITGDTTAPSLSSAQVDGATLVLTYDETLDVDSVPGTDAFSIEVDGTAAAPSEVAVDGSEVTLTLASAASAGQAVTLSYTVPSGATPQPIQDEAGNDAAALSDRAVVNYTVTPLPGTYEDEVAVPDDWGLIPSGLGSGDRFRLLFVSSTKRSAVTSAIEDYDILVRNAAGAGHADIRGYAPQFKVLGCTLASAARNRTGTTYTASDKGVPVYWLGGARVADDYEDFYDGDWDSNAPRHESGALGPTADGDGSEVFTGCNANGTIATSGRIGNTANNQVNVGWPGGNGQEIDHGTTNRNNSRSYYGLSTVFRVGDTTAPSLSSAWVDGAVLVLTYDEALDATSVPGTGAFSVTVGGAAAALSEVAIDGSEVTLTLATAASAGQAVTLSYTVPTGANAMPIQDEASNDAAALSDEAVENYTATPLTDTYEDEVTVPADWSLIPGGVAPGERFRLLFVTSTKRDAKLQVIDNYDPHVRDAAAAGHADIRGYAPQFRVLGCTLLSSAARNRTGTTYTASDKGVPIYWLGGARVADDYEDFYDGDWDSNAPRHESGALGPTADGADAQVFTGCNADGTKSASARPLGGTGSNNNVRVGWPGSNGQEIVYQSIDRGSTRSFYGLSTVFRVSINNAGDTAAPALHTARVDGATLVLTYDEALDETSVPGTAVFSIEVDGTATAPSGVAIDGSAVTLTLATAVTASQAVTLSYTVPSGANAMPIQDGDGYNAAALSDEAVTNITGDTTAPSLSSAQVDGATLVLTYDETLDVDSVPGTDAFSIEVDGTAAAPSGVAVDGPAVTLTLASAAAEGQAVTLSYTVPSGANPQPIQDEAGNDAAALSDRAVVNRTVTPLPGTYEDEIEVPDDWGLIPNGLGSGDRFRLLFVSSTKRSAVTSIIEDYDILVRNAAAAGHADIRGYAPQFKVLGCTLVSAARNRTGTTYTASDKGVPVYWLGGARVADDYEDFYDGDWDSNAPRHESGTLGPTADGDGSEVFTGCNANGTIATSGRIGNTANNQVNVGWPGGNGQEIDHGTTNRNNSRSYYGLSTVFRVGDTTAPVLSKAQVDGATLVLTYDETLDVDSVPGTDAFSVSLDGGAGSAPSEVAVDGSEVTLTLATAVSAGKAVTLSYTVPSGANAMPIQDEAGNDAAALSDEAVTNVTGDGTVPSLSSARVDGATLVLTYDKALDPDSVPGTDAFSVDVDGTAAAPSGVAIDGSAVTLTLATAVTAGQAVTLSYTVPTGVDPKPIQDGNGHNAAALSDKAVTNVTGDGTAPSLRSARVDGATLVLTYDETLDVDSVPGTDAFSIDVAGTAAAPSGVAVDGSSVTLTLATAVAEGQAVTLSYTVPTGVDPQPIQDEAGNDAAALSDRAVTNVTGDTTAPVLNTAQVDGAALVLTYDEALDVASVPGTDAFSISLDGGAGSAPSEVAIDGSEVTLTLATAAAEGQGVTLSYTVPTGVDPQPIQDEAGNDAAALSDRAVTNVTDDTVAPTLVSARVDGATLVLTYDETLDVDSVPGTDAFLVRLHGGTGSAPSGVAVDGSAVTLTLATAATPGQTATVSYTIPAGANAMPIQDEAGNDAAALSDRKVGNVTGDGTVTPTSVRLGSAPDVREAAIDVCWVPGITIPARQGVKIEVSYRQGWDYPARFGSWREVAQGDSFTQCGAGGVLVTIDKRYRGSAFTGLIRLYRGRGGQFAISPLFHAQTPNANGAVLNAFLSEPMDETGMVVETATGPFLLELYFEGPQEPLLTVELVKGLASEDFEVTNGMVTGIEEWSGMTYTVIVTPTTLGQPVTIKLPAGTVKGVGPTIEDGGNTYTRDNEESNEVTVQTAAANQQVAGGPLTATLGDERPESHNGTDAVSFQLQFSDAISTTVEDMRDHALSVNGGTVTGARQVDGRANLWEIEITPSGQQSLSILILPTTDCAVAGAICTTDGRMLTTAPGLSIPYVPTRSQGRSQLAPLTASFSGVPAEHDGSTPFALDLTFSEEPQGLSFKTVRDSLFTVTGGAITRAKRLEKPLNRLYRLTVAPDGNDDVRLALATPLPACGKTGAVCTGDGRALSGPLAATVLGPPALSVADAAVDEGPGAALDFAVTLDRAPSGTVTVDYATSDGTATVGEDYTETRGTLSFAAGETSKTVSVPVLDDAHDEGDETLTLTLSNPSGAYLEDATATGTIRNTDLMPQAWLARFGRTVADQVIDAVAGRLMASPAPGIAVSVAGERIGGGEAAADEPEAKREAEAQLEALSTWFRGDEERESAHGFRSRAVTEREILTGTSFAVTEGSAETGFVGLWGRGAVSRFDGREGTLRLDGEAESAMLGADWTGARGTVGLVLSHTRGEGGYRSAQGDGAVSSTLTGVYPYGRYEVSDRLSLWGIVGLGQGTLTLTPEGMDPIETDMDLTMAALGGRGVLVEAPATGGIELAATSDAMVVRTASDEVRGSAGSLAASEADVTRLRLGLEGTWRGLGSIVPTFEIGVRQDGGDAETGFGADIGAGLAWSDPASGIAATVSARGLLTHEDSSFRERGFVGSFAWDSDPASDLGPSLTLSQTVGAPATGGMNALLRPNSAEALLGGDEDDLRNHHLEATLGYGIPVFGGRYTATPALGFGLTEAEREVSHSWRLAEVRGSGLLFGLDQEVSRRERIDGAAAPEQGFVLGLGWQLESPRREGASFGVRFEASHTDVANDNRKPETAFGIRMTAMW